MSPYSSSSAPWFSAMERWSSSHVLTPSRSPLVAALRRIFILLQPSLAQIADNHGLAVLIHSIGELLTGHVDTGSPKAPQILVLKKVPNPHRGLWFHICTIHSLGSSQEISTSKWGKGQLAEIGWRNPPVGGSAFRRGRRR